MLPLLVALALPVAHAGDKDKDGIPNKIDMCKDSPEDFDGFQDHDGCNDTDNDIDGIPDGQDACPDEAEDDDGVDDDDGCPDLDDDQDGIQNDEDQCPLEPEDAKADPLDGCPEVDFDTLTGGWMKSVGDLSSLVLEVATSKGEGCGAGATKVKGWFEQHDPVVEAQVFEAQLKRRPEYLEEQTFRDLLAGKGGSYDAARKAVVLFCKDDASWQEIQPRLDEVMKPWMKGE